MKKMVVFGRRMSFKADARAHTHLEDDESVACVNDDRR